MLCVIVSVVEEGLQEEINNLKSERDKYLDIIKAAGTNATCTWS